MGLITETNAQYYSGQQMFTVGSSPQWVFDATFDTPLQSAYDINGNEIASTSNYNVFVIFPGISPIQLAQNTSYVSGPNGSQITIPGLEDPATVGYQLIIQLTEPTIGTNYGSYEYISLNDIVTSIICSNSGFC